jgi:hypothetical protein
MRNGMAVVGTLSLVALIGCGGKTAVESTTGTIKGTGATAGSASTTGASTTTSTSGSTGTTGTTSTAASSSGTTGTAASSTSSGSTTGTFQTAAHSDFPQVPNNSGVQTLQHAQVVTITYAGDARVADIEDFDSWLAASPWLAEVGADYGVLAGKNIANVHLTETVPAAITDDEIQTLLVGKLNSGILPPPGTVLPDGTTVSEPVYSLFFPQGTRITLGTGAQAAQSCQSFGGYHSSFIFFPGGHGPGVNVAYAVLPQCSGFAPGFTNFQGVEVAMSHELIEAATDPYPQSNPGFSIQSYSSPWAFIPGEVGDLCVGQNYLETVGTKQYGLQRSWSNSAAAAHPGKSPCVPAAPGAFFNVATDLVQTQTAAAGSTVTYKVTAWSDRVMTQEWGVFVSPYQGNFYPRFTLDSAPTATHPSGQHSDQNSRSPIFMKNGDTATLKVTIPASTASQSATILIIGSGLTAASYNLWPVAIFVQ